MNFTEILKVFKSLKIDRDIFAGKHEGCFDTYCKVDDNVGVTKPISCNLGRIFDLTQVEKHIDGLGKMIIVHQNGGSGQGDYWNIVRYFKDHNVYISLNGWYSSYEGVDVSSFLFEEVEPQEKKIIVFNNK